MRKTRVAVYGSLRQDMGNHRVLDGTTFIGHTTILNMGMVSLGGYPACDFTDGGMIVVEIYEVDDIGLDRLDRLEGTDPTDVEGGSNYYNRRDVLTVDHGMAWVYFIPNILDDGRPAVADGNWVRHMSEVA